jgi:hypothetical protein
MMWINGYIKNKHHLIRLPFPVVAIKNRKLKGIRVVI